MTDEERRYAAFAALEAAHATGDEIEIGKAMTKLSWLARQIGLGEQEGAWCSAARYGLEAVNLLRGKGDPEALVDALQAAAMPFMTGLDHIALLRESLEISREAGLRRHEAWALFYLGNQLHDDSSRAEALQIFEELGDAFGCATVRRSRAFRRGLRPREKADEYIQCAEDYLSLGRREEAHKALVMAQVFGTPGLRTKESEALLLRAIELTDKPVFKALCYRNLARIRSRIGDRKSERKFLAAEDALDDEAYGSRAKRLEADLETLREDLELSERKERKALKLKIRTLERELAALTQG